MYHYIAKYDKNRKYYTFVVLGQTGTGKTTLLDAFVNKIAEIEYIDNWRYQLVDESALNLALGQSKTQ